MSEFKGTKGKWEKTLNYIGEGFYIYTIYVNKKRICDIRRLNPMGVIDIEEQKANALLISKAPEMLEMLNKLVERLEENDLGRLNAVSQAKQLIKEATEL
jgi:hypothetical protein